MLPPQLDYVSLTAQQQLHRSSYLRHERKQFAYLPTPGWMQRGRYEEIYVGDYQYSLVGETTYRVLFLSQSGLCLLYHGEQFVQALFIKTDEDLLRLLVAASFPLPQ